MHNPPPMKQVVPKSIRLHCLPDGPRPPALDDAGPDDALDTLCQDEIMLPGLMSQWTRPLNLNPLMIGSTGVSHRSVSDEGSVRGQ